MSEETDQPFAFTDLLADEELLGQAQQLVALARENILTLSVAIELALVAAVFVVAAFVSPRLKNLINTSVMPHISGEGLRRAVYAVSVVMVPIAMLVLLNVVSMALTLAGQPTGWVDAALSLITAWIVIRLVTLIIRSRFWSRVAFYVVWPIAALDVFGILDDVVLYLEGLAIPLGATADGDTRQITALDVVRGFIAFVLFFWIANLLSRFLSHRIYQIEELTPSLQTLIVKILNILLPVLAVFAALQLIGVNLAALAVFSGAVGLGIGLGLQRTVANLIGGFTLVADRSIKPGDVVTVGDTFGWVTSLGARYVSIRTRDGTEHLVPNEDFITHGVINWSHQDRAVRIHAPFGVSYGTEDLRFIQQLAQDAAAKVERVLEHPKPVCNLVGFGDSSVDFDLRFWISDPQKGVGNVRSEVFLNVWDALKENNVEIPFPQQDVHIKSGGDAVPAADLPSAASAG